jgi:alpha-galactosidase
MDMQQHPIQIYNTRRLKMTKITFIGAGSTMFARNLLCDIFSFSELRDITVMLEDLDEQRLEMTYKLASRLVEQEGYPAKIERTTNQKEALKNSDFVIVMFQIGGLEAYDIDKKIPLKYGIDQTVGDTLGPGGTFRGIRSIPVLIDICRDMEEVCPNAILLNYANPMAALMWAVNRATTIQSVGLCHSVQATTRQLAGYIGAGPWENYPFTEEEWEIFFYAPIPEKINFFVAGINHQAWYLKYEVDGEDAYPKIRKAYNDPKAYEADAVRFEILKHFGYFVTESPNHMSEYVPYFRKNPDMVKRFVKRRWDYYDICVQKKDALDAEIRRQIDGKEKIKVRASVEYGSQIVHAVLTGKQIRINGNVNNSGLISNLPSDCCVEVPCLVDKNGINPCYVGELPPQLAAINRTNINVQSLIVEAALNREREAAYHAVMVDPLTSALLTLDDIRKMVDEMFEAEKQWLRDY